MRKTNILFTILVVQFFLINTLAAQDSVKVKPFNIHFQATYIYQIKPGFHSPYAGINSLSGKHEKQNSITTTLFAGARLWKGAAVYINPEVAGGSGLSGALGMGGSSNGETFRVGDPAPTLYFARYFLEQTFALSKEKTFLQDDANVLQGPAPKNYLKILFGKFALSDLFDQNNFSNSPRTQFLNWGLMNDGAWDYAANVRGYTYSLSAELKLNDFSYKLGLATLPKEANGASLNTNFKDSFSLGINAEVDKVFASNGNLRIMAFNNIGNFGNYNAAAENNSAPDITATRKLRRTKTGIEINVDKSLTKTTGIFGRAGWNDGKNETWVFTEIDKTASLGLSFNGSGWKRNDDNAGIAAVVNEISKPHKNYLAKGGAGFILGDGKLNYAPEAIAEIYYNCKPSNIPLWLTADYQFALHPGYNKDRGPVHIFSFRVHTEF